jgi:predicted acyltransferase
VATVDPPGPSRWVPGPERVASLDAFRGFAIASMVLVNNPGDWKHVHAPLLHAPWHGWTFTDLVFPFFLFAAGAAMAISLDRRSKEPGAPSPLPGLARRAAVIFAVGLALNLLPVPDLATLRIPGVLQRIALCVLAAAPLALYAGNRAIALSIALLLAAYTLPMLLVPVPGYDGAVAAGLLEPGRDFGAWLDRAIFGDHLWRYSKTWDPEGLWSTLPAIASLLFGVLAGRALLRARGGLATSTALLGAGVACLAAGLALDAVLMPINKNLWTPSYCIFMTGWSLVAFAAFHAAMDGAPSQRVRQGARALLKPFTIYGMNALFIFALSGFIARLLNRIPAPGEGGTLKAWLYAPLQSLPLSPENVSLAFAIAFEIAMFAVAWIMWRNRWFVKA